MRKRELGDTVGLHAFYTAEFGVLDGELVELSKDVLSQDRDGMGSEIY